MNLATTADKSMLEDSPNVRLMPPAVFFTCLTLGGILEFLMPQAFPILPPLMRIALGIAIGTAGFGFMWIANEKFETMGTNVPTNLPATMLVIQGPFHLTRNPMYLGGSAFFLGMGLALGSLWMLAAYLPLGLYLSLFVIPREEAYMERMFGDDYRKYCETVRRWL